VGLRSVYCWEDSFCHLGKKHVEFMSRHQWYQLVSICRVFIGTSWFQYVAPSSVPAGFNMSRLHRYQLVSITTFTWSVLRWSLPCTDNEWSGSERDLLSQRLERANALATSTRRRLVMKCTWSRRLTCKRSKDVAPSLGPAGFDRGAK